MTFRRRKSSRPTTVLDHVRVWVGKSASRGEALCLAVVCVALLLVLGG